MIRLFMVTIKTEKYLMLQISHLKVNIPIRRYHFRKLKKAYFAIDENNDWLLSRGGIQLFSFNAKASYDFKPSLVSEFLLSKNTFEKNTFNVDKPNKSAFGLEVYQKNNRRFAEV